MNGNREKIPTIMQYYMLFGEQDNAGTLIINVLHDTTPDTPLWTKTGTGTYSAPAPAESTPENTWTISGMQDAGEQAFMPIGTNNTGIEGYYTVEYDTLHWIIHTYDTTGTLTDLGVIMQGTYPTSTIPIDIKIFTNIQTNQNV